MTREDVGQLPRLTVKANVSFNASGLADFIETLTAQMNAMLES